MDWSVLGISETKDKQKITAAYRSQLKYANPEDDPEKFQELRAAYEEALRLADETDPEKVQSTGDPAVDAWFSRLTDLYNSFRKRIDAECWQELLSDDVCIALDKRPKAEAALLNFLKENWFLPQNVWQCLNDYFKWTDRRDFLYENYPRNFVDYAIFEGIKYPASLPYDLFSPGTDGKVCDELHRLYNRASRISGAELDELLNNFPVLSEQHPYVEAVRYRAMLGGERRAEAISGYKALTESYPEDTKLLWDMGCIYLQDDLFEAAESVLRRARELSPDHIGVKVSLADALAGLRKFDEAKELIYAAMDAAGGNQKELYNYSEKLKVWNEEMIKDREARYAADPGDGENASELGWCYLQNDREQDALKICQALDPGSLPPYEYHNLYGKVLYYVGDFESCLAHLKQLADIVREMKPDGTEKTARRIKKLPEILGIQASVLTQLKREDEAMALFEEAYGIDPDNPDTLTNLSRFLAAKNNYERASELLIHLTEILPGSYHGHFLLANAYYKLHRDRDAFEEVNRALELDGGDLYVYILKLQILIRNGVWDQTKELLDFLDQNNVGDETAVLWCKGLYTELCDKNDKDALAVYEKIAERVEKGENHDFNAQLYFRIALLNARKPQEEITMDRQALIATLDKGLKHDPDDPDCLDYKAWLLQKDKKNEEALALYQKLESMPNHSLNVERSIADIYYQDLAVNAQKALDYYKKLPDHNDNCELLFYIGTCNRYLYNFDAAEKAFLRMKELDPNDTDVYRGLSFVYEYQKDFEKALEQQNILLDMVRGTEEDDDASRYTRKIRLLRRLNRPVEAIETVDERASKFKDTDPFATKYDICVQFGMLDEAEKLLKQWSRTREEPQELAARRIDIDICRRDFKAAKKTFRAEKKHLTDYEKYLKSTILANSDMDWKECLRLKANYLPNTNDKSLVYMGMADYYSWMGNVEKSREYAQMALDIVENELPNNRRNETLYRTRRIWLYYLLGRKEEAMADFNKVPDMHLCEFCSYGSCKDLNYYEMLMAELDGDYEKAAELAKKYDAMWPDDTGFYDCLRRLERKGIKL